MGKEQKKVDRSPTTKTVGTSYTTGGDGGAGWVSSWIPAGPYREVELLLDVDKNSATKLYLKLEVGDEDADTDAEGFNKLRADGGGVLVVDENSYTLAADERIAVTVEVPAASRFRVRLKADTAADAIVTLYTVGGRP